MKIHRNYKSTREIKTSNKISYLDIKITKTKILLKIDVYRIRTKKNSLLLYNKYSITKSSVATQNSIFPPCIQ